MAVRGTGIEAFGFCCHHWTASLLPVPESRRIAHSFFISFPHHYCAIKSHIFTKTYLPPIKFVYRGDQHCRRCLCPGVASIPVMHCGSKCSILIFPSSYRTACFVYLTGRPCANPQFLAKYARSLYCLVHPVCCMKRWVFRAAAERPEGSTLSSICTSFSTHVASRLPALI